MRGMEPFVRGLYRDHTDIYIYTHMYISIFMFIYISTVYTQGCIGLDSKLPTLNGNPCRSRLARVLSL